MQLFSNLTMRVFQNSEDKEFTDYLLSCGDGLLPTIGHLQGGQFKVTIPAATKQGGGGGGAGGDHSPP